jgi:hypothetical protein
VGYVWAKRTKSKREPCALLTEQDSDDFADSNMTSLSAESDVDVAAGDHDSFRNSSIGDEVGPCVHAR